MLGCTNPNLGQILTNPNVGLKMSFKKITVESESDIFNPTFGFVDI